MWALPAESGGVLLKHFRVRGAEAFKYMLRPSRARSEYSAMQAFARLGLPAVTALGYGERRASGRLVEAWFLGRFVPDAQTVGEAQQAAAACHDHERVMALARGSLVLTSRLHHHPWLHRDLHAHNLLLTHEGVLLITDLHSVWRVPRLTRTMRNANLARLLFSMRGVLNLDDDVPELLVTYAEAMALRIDSVVAQVNLALSSFESEYVRGRTARCLTASTLFTTGRLGTGRLYRRRTYSDGNLRADLYGHGSAVQSSDGVLGRAASSVVTRVDAGPSGHGARVIKEFTQSGLLPSVRQRSGYSRARGAWVAARLLDIYGISTPEGLALLERAGGSAVLVTREAPGAVSLRVRAQELAGRSGAVTGARISERAALARAVGCLVGHLAKFGLRHADLSAKNLLVTAQAPPQSHDMRVRPPPHPPYVTLIDLDGLKRMPAHDSQGIARMLGQLGDLPSGVTRTDLLRFRHAYAAASGRDIPDEVSQAAARQTRARVLRRERLSRPAKDVRDSI